MNPACWSARSCRGPASHHAPNHGVLDPKPYTLKTARHSGRGRASHHAPRHDVLDPKPYTLNPARLSAGAAPPTTRPNTVCLKSRWRALLYRMKNWLPLLSLPLLAMDSTPRPLCASRGSTSSRKGAP